MKKFALIPARYDSSRFPGKLMKILGDKTIIRHTYENTVATQLFDDVFVATDSPIIYDEIVSNGGKAVMSKRAHESGSDRIAEAIADMDVDIVLNVQGDEPFVQKEPLQKLLQAFEGENGKSVKVASLMRRFTDAEMVKEASNVKVVVDLHNNSLLFIQSGRVPSSKLDFVHHICRYIGDISFTRFIIAIYYQKAEHRRKRKQISYQCFYGSSDSKTSGRFFK